MSDEKKNSSWTLAAQTGKHAWHRLWHTRLAVLSVVIGWVALAQPVIQDLFFEPMDLPGRFLFLLTIVVFWTIPVHRAARAGVESMPADNWGVTKANLTPKLMARIRGARRRIDTWLPRVLGAATLGIPMLMLLAIMSGLGTLSGLSDPYGETLWQLGMTELWLALALLCYAIYLAVRERLRNKSRSSYSGAMHDEPWRSFGIAHTAFSLIYFMWALLLPLGFTGIIGRISLLPVLLGAPLPILSPIAVRGNRWRIPFILLALVAVVLVSSLNGAFHDVRRFESQGSKDGATRAVALDDAIAAWMKANDCSGNGAACPPAILVAASGGGSRAAFFTATMVGEVLDRIGGAEPGQQIFAISGVSGGSVGAAIIRAALTDAEPGSLNPPCRNRSKLWFRATKVHGEWADRYSNGKLDPASAGKPDSKTWKNCLQDLAASDMLSAPIAGLAYRDYFALPVPEFLGGGDRNVLIEQALEQNYNYVLHNDPNACAAGATGGICQPLGYRAQKGGPDSRWVPLLLLNTTSVDHGSLIVASDFDVSGWCLPNAVDMFHLFRSESVEKQDGADGQGDATEQDATPKSTVANEPPSPCKPNFVAVADAWAAGADDLRLSTASILSGRFPIILTAGNLRNRSQKIAERVVDGGYFDNSGTASLRPVLTQLAAHHIRTLTLLLDNEPADVKTREEVRDTQDESSAGEPKKEEPKEKESKNELVPVDIDQWQRASAPLFEPLRTLERIRAVRADEAIAVYEAEVALIVQASIVAQPKPDQQKPDQPEPEPMAQTFHFTVAGTLEGGDCTGSKDKVSLHNLVVSWWLSPIGQLFVDTQLCAAGNQKALGKLDLALNAAPTSPTPE